MQELLIQAPTFTVKITGDNERDLIKQAAFWQSIPNKCPICGAPLIFNYRTPQTFVYYELRCKGTPSHSVNFGEAKVSHDLYFDNKKQWKTYQPNAIDATPETQEPTPALPATTNPSGSGSNPNIGARKNHAIKLIQKCKDAGIRSGYVPADVAKMSEVDLENAIQALAVYCEKGGVAL